jgi:hypothetical protein
MQINNLNRAYQRDVPILKTGIVQQFNLTSASVAIDGSVLELEVLDHVTLAIGQTVVCSVQGRVGLVIGSLGTTTRAQSAVFDGGLGNPTAPDVGIPQTFVAEFTPTIRVVNSGFYGALAIPTSTFQGANGWYSLTATTAAGATTSARSFAFFYSGIDTTLIDAVAITKIELKMDTWRLNSAVPAQYIRWPSSGLKRVWTSNLASVPAINSAPTAPTLSNQIDTSLSSFNTTNGNIKYTDITSDGIANYLKTSPLASLFVGSQNSSPGDFQSGYTGNNGRLRITYLA